MEEFIVKHSILNIKEKKKFGEVFTPLVLINQIIDKITELFPNYWSNPNLKILDPANGIGNFPFVIYIRLMDGLKHVIPNKQKRKKHILENMIYMIELNPNNILLTKQLFKLESNVKLNLITGDFLTHDFKEQTFDLIISNPPYQKNNTNTGNAIWPFFVRKSCMLLKNNALLSIIHPAGWRKPISEKAKTKDLYELLTKTNQMLYLEIHNTKDGMNTFGAGTRYDWYVLQKHISNKKTIIIDEIGKKYTLNLSKYSYLPNYNFKNVFKIIAKSNEEHVNILFSSSKYEARKTHVQEIKNNIYKYPLIHSTPLSGIRYMYSSNNNQGHFGIPKVIFGDSGIYNSIIDTDGKYGMTSHAIAIVDEKKNLKYIKEAIESNEFKKILDACSWSNYQIDSQLFSYFRKDFWKDFI